MQPRDLTWTAEAIADYKELLRRRHHNWAAVDHCVQRNLLAVAEDPAIARRDSGPVELLIYRFKCDDGETRLNLQANLEELPDGTLVVLSCNTIQF